MEIDDYKNKLKDFQSIQNQLRFQLRDAEDKVKSYENIYYPKLKDTKKY